MIAQSTYEELANQVEDLKKKIEGHKDKEEALIESGALFKDLYELSPLAVVISEYDSGSIIGVNERFLQLSGYSMDDLYDRSSVVVGIYSQEISEELMGILEKDGGVFDYDLDIVAEDGNKVHVLAYLREIKILGEKHLMSVYFDITKRLQALKELKESEEQYRGLFETASDLIQFVSPDGYLLNVNPSWCKTLGYEKNEAIGMPVINILLPEGQTHCQQVFQDVLKIGSRSGIETTFKTKTGEKVMVEGAANCMYDNEEPVFTRCIFRDVTDRKRAEEEILKAQKLESIGVLAGGIAHDFNNILTAILGNISLAKMYAEGDTKVVSKLDATEKAVGRAKDLTLQLLTFSKGGVPVKKISSLVNLLQEVTEFILRGSNVKCELDIYEKLWMADVDSGQISQVVNNLVMNADQAMPEGGTISIGAENVVLDGTESIGLDAGSYLRIYVTDQGTGIRKEHLPRIFDPYFSTKQKGHGLGLASAYSIIMRHGGVLSVDSEHGKGSTFYFYLPAFPESEVVELNNEKEFHASRCRILFMDDEEDVRRVTSEMIVLMGCEVEAVSEGGTAIKKYQQALDDGKPFDVVIMDLTVPGGIGGQEAVKELLKINPDAKVLVSSGYANDPVMADYRKYGFCGVVPKPYDILEMSLALKMILEEEKKKK